LHFKIRKFSEKWGGTNKQIFLNFCVFLNIMVFLTISDFLLFGTFLILGRRSQKYNLNERFSTWNVPLLMTTCYQSPFRKWPPNQSNIFFVEKLGNFDFLRVFESDFNYPGLKNFRVWFIKKKIFEIFIDSCLNWKNFRLPGKYFSAQSN